MKYEPVKVHDPNEYAGPSPRTMLGGPDEEYAFERPGFEAVKVELDPNLAMWLGEIVKTPAERELWSDERTPSGLAVVDHDRSKARYAVVEMCEGRVRDLLGRLYRIGRDWPELLAAFDRSRSAPAEEPPAPAPDAPEWEGPKRPTLLMPADRHALLVWLARIETQITRANAKYGDEDLAHAAKGLDEIRSRIAPQGKRS